MRLGQGSAESERLFQWRSKPQLSRLIVTLALLTSSCATYRPVPLDAPSASLSGPTLALLTPDAATINRPFLRPIAIDLSRPFTPDAIAVLAVAGNPDLVALRLRADVADAQVFAAGLLPDPTFSLGADKILSGPDAALNILGLTGGLGVNLSQLRTRAVARAKARAEARRVRLDLAWAEWQTAGKARVQAVRIVALERLARLAKESRDSAETILSRTLRAAGRGDILPDQLQGARVAAFDAADRLRVADRDLATARVELVRLLGLPPDVMLRLAVPPIPSAPPATPVLYEIAWRNRTDLQALRAGYAAQEATVRKAVLDQFPNLDLSINGARDTAGNVTLGPSVSLTLPIWNRNRGVIRVEQATRAALKAEYGARLFQVRAEIAAAVETARVLRLQRQAILRDLPALERFAAANRAAARRGDLAENTAVTAEQALRDKQLLLAQIERDLAEQMIALELLTGTPRESWAA